MENFDPPQPAQFSKIAYEDGSVKWTMTEPHSVMIDAVFIDGQDRIYTAGYLMESVGDADMYIARYTQGGSPKYSITKSTGDWQIVTVSSYTAPLVSIVNIFGTTTPASGIGINFTISTFPAGATGFSLSKSSEATNPQGLADVILKLGNIPAEYGVTATCADCESSSNAVTFTCCGKLPNDHFSQSHVPAWSYECYANNDCQTTPNATIGWRGCAVTALATLTNYYANTFPELNISTTTPGALNTYLRNNDGYDDNNNVRFRRINNYSHGDISYIRNESGNVSGDITRQVLLERADNELLAGRPVIFRVTGHFILVIGKCGDHYVISNPAGGVERLYSVDETIYEFVGIRIFRP